MKDLSSKTYYIFANLDDTREIPLAMLTIIFVDLDDTRGIPPAMLTIYF